MDTSPTLPCLPLRQSRRTADVDRAETLLEVAVSSRNAAESARLRHEAVLLCLEFADSCARRYSSRGAELEDLVQVAHAALVKAANRYRSGVGTGFAAYARATINGEIKHYFRDCCWSVRPPRGLQEGRKSLTSAQEHLRQQLCREPSLAELATSLGWTDKEVEDVIACQTAFRAASLDNDGDESDLSARKLVVEDQSASVADRLVLAGSMKAMTQQERRILHLRFVSEMTQAEIGEELGVSQMQVSRLLSGIIERLRAELGVSAAVA